MIPDYVFRQGDQGPTFVQQLAFSDGTAPDFTQASSIGLVWRSTGDDAPLTLHALPSVVPNQPDTLQWQPDSVDAANIEPGDYLGYWTAVIGGKPMSFPTSGNLWMRVEPALTDAELLDLGSRPSNAQVAALLRARTKVRGGQELGYFADGQTRPGATDVEALIDEALDEVLGKVVGIDPTATPGTAYNAPGSKYERRIRSAVALMAAIMVETSYFPDSAKGPGTIIDTYQKLYKSRIDSLIVEDKLGHPEGLGDAGQGGAGGGADAPADAAWSFPADNRGLVGWQTRW